MCIKIYTPGIEELLDKEDIDAIEKQIKNGAPVNVKNKMGITPLHLAALNNRYELVKKLIDKKADVNAKTSKDAFFSLFTPLHFASQKDDNIPTVKLLIENGADLNARGGLGSTPLHSAIYHKDASFCEPLLKYGADPLIKDKHGATPISELETFNKPRMLEMLKNKSIKK
ncbi:MAG TPA: ankyrin repeat domain-containing protein [Candidatus Wallbacteria bacterium]|nr:ankyrin repeat domain-containing protein [Candidatus Wallbacteria bacterium]